MLGELIRPVTWVYDLLRTYTKYKVNSSCSHWILVSGWQSNTKTGGGTASVNPGPAAGSPDAKLLSGTFHMRAGEAESLVLPWPP